MMTIEFTPSGKGKVQQDGQHFIDTSLIETLWHRLDGQVSREQISRVVCEIATQYENATVQAFVPILIQRQALAYFQSKTVLGKQTL